MKSLLTLLIILSTLLLAVSGQLSNLSPSYSLQGALARTENGELTLTAAYSVAVDITLGLQYVDEVVTASGAVSDNMRLSSENDSATYLSVNNVCTETAFNPNVIFPLNTNVWDMYATGTESPAGTYTFTQDGITYQVTLINGIPASFTFSFSSTVIIVSVSNFNNITPDFSTFSLPRACFRSSCLPCYQTPPLSHLSPSYSMSGTGISVRTLSSQTFTNFTFEVFVDIDRELQLVEYTETDSGVTTNTITLSSRDGFDTFTILNGECDDTPYAPNLLYPISRNVWELYANGNESPDGTYSFEENRALRQVAIEDGLPTVLTFTIQSTVFTLNISSFNNTTPDIAVFSLPTECGRPFSCPGCYSRFPIRFLSQYTITGSGLRVESGQTPSTFTFRISMNHNTGLNQNRGFQLIEESVTTSGIIIDTVQVSSINDLATYTSVDGVCADSRSYNPNLNFPIDTESWGLYGGGIQSPTGTYTFTRDGIVHQVVVEMEALTSFRFSFGNTVIVLAVSNFERFAPFTTFFVPRPCSQFFCGSCFQPPPFPDLSPSYSLSGSGVRLDAGIPFPAFSFTINIDIDRQLQLIQESDTINGFTRNTVQLSGGIDLLTYTSIDGVCADNTTYNPSPNFPIDTNVWELYRNGVESSLGTYSFTQDDRTYQVVIEDGLPTSFEITFETMEIRYNVDSFINMKSDFITFLPPLGCTRLFCFTCFRFSQFPTLSPSYTISGVGVVTESGETTITFTFEISIDIDKQLQFISESDTVNGVTTNFIEITSANDLATYTSVDGVCTDSTTYNPSLAFPIDTNVWELYASGIESPIGTYTFTQNEIAYQVVIEDELPATFVVASGSTGIGFRVDSFNNKTPEFSTFCLPGGCSAHECDACYSGAAAVASSVLLVISALLVYLMTAA